MAPFATTSANPTQAALEAHQQGNTSAALKLYPKALASTAEPQDLIFVNYGALLRASSRNSEAEAVYRRGLKTNPECVQLLRNYGNLRLSEGHSLEALGLFLEAERLLPPQAKPGKLEAIWRQQAETLADLGYPKLALKLLEPVLEASPDDQCLRLWMADLQLELGQPARARKLAQSALLSDLPSLGESFIQCNLLLKLGDHELALEKFQTAISSYQRRVQELDEKTRQKFDTTCWNFALMLLRRGLLKRGWELFEHGRRVPNGKGGMQRTVFKQYPARMIPEWDGSDLKGKNLLINGEQGIGDVLMFTMLVPPLLQEAKQVGIVTYDRLKPLYERSFPDCKVYDTRDFKHKSIDPEAWDLQVPVGSLPMLRHPTIESYQGLKPFMKVDTSMKAEFKERFHPAGSSPLIGFSWRGGGNTKQKRTKSLKLEDFLPLFQKKGLRWISLQYGAVNDELRNFNKTHGLDLLIADDVNPLQDMDRWSALVACCDLVISAANTTIHGSGCLGVPTWVILGKDPDWRWLGEPETPCYWYPSVNIVRQRELGSWAEPIDQLNTELVRWQDGGA